MYRRIINAAGRKPTYEFCAALLTIIQIIFEDDHLVWTEPPREWPLFDEEKAYTPERLRLATDCIEAFFTQVIMRFLPEAAFSASAANMVTVPLITLAADPGLLVQGCCVDFINPTVTPDGDPLFPVLRARLFANLRAASGLVPEFELVTKRLVFPTKSDLDPSALVETYLHNTVFEVLLTIEVPFTISIAKRLEHTAIIAGSGWGKTQLLQSIIINDLEQPDPPSIVVIDSTNRMIERLQRISIFTDRLKDRIVIIDPERSPAPALNMFDINTPRMQGYTPDMRERVETDIVGLFAYVFSSIQNPLSDPMRTALSYVIRLLVTVPGVNITTLRNLLEENNKGGYEASNFKQYIDKLDPTAKDFFKLQFFTERVAATRSSILQRLSSVISVPAFERMFSTVNKIDFFDEMQRGSCILVNTSEALLKDASALFGRYIIARVMAAAFERAPLPDDKRRPTFLIVDEAAPYFDDQFEKLLTRVRQFKLGVVIAFQHLEQAPEKLRSAIASNTTVKYAGGLGYADSRWLAREMRSTPEALLALRKDEREPPQFTGYACHVRGMGRPVNLTAPFYVLENMLKMTDEQHALLLDRNRERTSYTAPPAAPAPHSGPQPPEAEAGVESEPAASPKSESTQPPSNPAPTVPPAKPDPQPSAKTTTPAPGGPAADDPHTGDHTEPATKWGEK
jgi:hypothetical protein